MDCLAKPSSQAGLHKASLLVGDVYLANDQFNQGTVMVPGIATSLGRELLDTHSVCAG